MRCTALRGGGCRRVVLYPGAGELRECRVGVLAAVPAAQLPQGLQAGRPAAQALLASDSAHQTETGQRVTDGSAPALGTAALGARMGVAGHEGCVWGENVGRRMDSTLGLFALAEPGARMGAVHCPGGRSTATPVGP